PNLIEAASRHGTLLILAAGRLTERSYKRYKLIKGFMSTILYNFDLICPVGDFENKMFLALGAPPHRLSILGNPKFDNILSKSLDPAFIEKGQTLAKKLGGDNFASETNPLIVAGSTHCGEEKIIIEAFIKLAPQNPNARLLLAPRHLNRLKAVAQEIKAHGFEPVFLSACHGSPPFLSPNKIVVLDTMGDLPHFYSLATIAIVGGSLCLGLRGHNPLEPAAFGAAILFGPYMESFRAESQALLAAGGACATTASSLAQDLAFLLAEPLKAEKVGAKAKNFLNLRPKAAPKIARAILNECKKRAQGTLVSPLAIKNP
ncbi:MAG: 3-deoxy-D-manno-octulosonic acid transferase, partial [Candidatus Adiutrix sp.]